jgi:hypothetical protein
MGYAEAAFGPIKSPEAGGVAIFGQYGPCYAVLADPEPGT